MPNESPQVNLPGRMYRKKTRWWWNVQLPGEDKARARALKPEGSRAATTEEQEAAEIALAMWQAAVRAEEAARVKAEEAAKAQRVRARFQERAKELTDMVEQANARARAEASARAQLEAELEQIRQKPECAIACECCGRLTSADEIHRIDSGQQLCRSCVDALREATRRQSDCREAPCPPSASGSGSEPYD
jgi:multidrug efflux pump subunit AcrA (membrane-fusion protein)